MGILLPAYYNWEMSQSTGHASDYITDTITFLDTTFTSFTHLPPALAKHVCMQVHKVHEITQTTTPIQACKYLCQRLLQLLTSSEQQAISSAALEQFNLDVMQCERKRIALSNRKRNQRLAVFASRAPVAGLDTDTLPLVFAELRQLLDLFIQV